MSANVSDMAVQDHDSDRPVTEYRVIPRQQREKQVADIVADVLKGSDAELPDLEAALHKTLKHRQKAEYADRQSFDHLIISNILMSKAVAKLANELKRLQAEVDTLKLFANPLPGSGTDNIDHARPITS